MKWWTRWRVCLASVIGLTLVFPATATKSLPVAEVWPDSPVAATFSAGRGDGYMRVEVTRHGNLLFESPQGVLLTAFDDGYALCAPAPTMEAFAYDLPVGEVWPLEQGFTSASVKQPTPGAFPVKIIRKTTDGRLRVDQTWQVPDAAERDVTVRMTVRNLTLTTIDDVALMRSADAHYSEDLSWFFLGATTDDTAFQWWQDLASEDVRGLAMTAGSLGRPHEAGMSTDVDLALSCGGFAEMYPDALRGGGFPQVVYQLGTLEPREEARFVFSYRRM